MSSSKNNKNNNIENNSLLDFTKQSTINILLSLFLFVNLIMISLIVMYIYYMSDDKNIVILSSLLLLSILITLMATSSVKEYRKYRMYSFFVNYLIFFGLTIDILYKLRSIDSDRRTFEYKNFEISVYSLFSASVVITIFLVYAKYINYSQLNANIN